MTTNVTQFDSTKVASRKLTTDRRRVGRWTSQEILFCIFGALARRCLDNKSPDVTCAWGTSDPMDGPPEAWIAFYSLSTNGVTRLFQRSNEDGMIRGNLEYHRTLTYLHSGVEQPSYEQYMHVRGKDMRDLFRNYVNRAHCLLIEELYNHHKEDAEAIVRDWELADFSYTVTSHKSSPFRSPMLDYDFISEVVHNALDAVYDDALNRRANNVMQLFESGVSNG